MLPSHSKLYLHKFDIGDIMGFRYKYFQCKTKIILNAFHWELGVLLMNVILLNIGSQGNIDFIGSVLNKTNIDLLLRILELIFKLLNFVLKRLKNVYANK